jgi:hypothetical protein
MKTIKQILTEARDLISDPSRWMQNDLAADDTGLTVAPNDQSACQWCADGALHKVIGYTLRYRSDPGFAEHSAACDHLAAAARELFGCGFVWVNDGARGEDETEAHANILKVFDHAIADCAEA